MFIYLKAYINGWNIHEIGIGESNPDLHYVEMRLVSIDTKNKLRFGGTIGRYDKKYELTEKEAEAMRFHIEKLHKEMDLELTTLQALFENAKNRSEQNMNKSETI